MCVCGHLLLFIVSVWTSQYHHIIACSICVLIQVAQQEAQRAQFVVEKAKQEKQQKIVQAEGEAQSAKLVSFRRCDTGCPVVA